MKKSVVLLVAFLFVVSAASWADTITFTGNGGSGTGSVSLGSTLSFTGGPLDLVKGLNICSSGCSITGGSVTLASGALTGPVVTNGNNKRYDFGAGGTLTLVGNVSGGPSGVLLTASFQGGELLINTLTGSASYAALLDSIFINPYFGVAVDGSNTENLKINWRTGGGKVTATGTTVDTVPSQTPEPATLTLLGIGLVGLKSVLRKQR